MRHVERPWTTVPPRNTNLYWKKRKKREQQLKNTNTSSNVSKHFLWTKVFLVWLTLLKTVNVQSNFYFTRLLSAVRKTDLTKRSICRVNFSPTFPHFWILSSKSLYLRRFKQILLNFSIPKYETCPDAKHGKTQTFKQFIRILSYSNPFSLKCISF